MWVLYLAGFTNNLVKGRLLKTSDNLNILVRRNGAVSLSSATITLISS